MKIPAQLKELSFCRVKKGTKAPFEKDWTNKPYYFHEIEKYINSENYGVLCGYRDLCIIDCDEESIGEIVRKSLVETFSVRTGGGGMHFYYFIPELRGKVILEFQGKHYGEIQSNGTQCVGAGSIHPNGKTYDVVNNVGIKEISLEELKNALGMYMKITEDKSTGNKNMNPVAFQIKEQVKMSTIAKKYGLSKHGRNWDCPFHDSRGGKSLGISDTNGIFHCFAPGCNASGNIIKFVQMLEDLKNGK